MRAGWMRRGTAVIDALRVPASERKSHDQIQSTRRPSPVRCIAQVCHSHISSVLVAIAFAHTQSVHSLFTVPHIASNTN